MIFLILLLTITTFSYLRKCNLVIDDFDFMNDKKPIKITVFNFINDVMNNLWKKVCKVNPNRWHIVVLGYHLTVVTLMYFVFGKIFGNEIATIATLLFAIHPCNNQGVCWISGRHYTLGGILALLGAISYSLPPIFIPIFLMGALFHPQNTVLPVIMLINKPTWIGLLYIAIFALFVPIYFKKAVKRVKDFGWGLEDKTFKLSRLNMIVKIANYYLFMALVPFRLGFFHSNMFGYNREIDVFNLKTVLGILSLVTFGVLAIIFKVQLPALFFGLLWFFTFLVPCMNIIHSNMLFSERYMYVPLIGFCLALAQVLILIPHYEIVVAVIATLYFIRSASYSIAWEDNVKLFGVNLRNQKNSVEAHVNLGDQLVKLHNCTAALPILQRSVELDPGCEMGWFNLGAAYVNLGDAVSARDCWAKAIKVNPKYVSPRYNLMRLNESVERQGGWEKLERQKEGWRELEVANK